jgi:hypothetical protein
MVSSKVSYYLHLTTIEVRLCDILSTRACSLMVESPGISSPAWSNQPSASCNASRSTCKRHGSDTGRINRFQRIAVRFRNAFLQRAIPSREQWILPTQLIYDSSRRIPYLVDTSIYIAARTISTYQIRRSGSTCRYSVSRYLGSHSARHKTLCTRLCYA